jgi:predicted RNase H-like HicB family nuclease
MTIMTLAAPAPIAPLPYAVIVEERTANHWFAQVLGWPECRAEENSREAAIATLKKVLQELLSRAEVIYLDVPKPKVENSIMKYAGMFEDDPQFDEVLAEIETYRKELDLGREELTGPDQEM